MKKSQSWRVGSRASALAVAQAQMFLQELDEASSEKLNYELCTQTTRGDRIQNVALRFAPGAHFFSQELDEALEKKQVDFCIHSLKDLSLDRPSGFVAAALSRRELLQDILILRKDLGGAAGNNELRLGTSAPRRQFLLKKFLKPLLPKTLQKRELIVEELRGNVPTRLSKLDLSLDQGGLHGVVLAAAGVVRLLKSQALKEMPSPYWMLLPLELFPNSPGQGALVAECLEDHQEIFHRLRQGHHVETQKAVELERDVLRSWGGGCHLALGVAALAWGTQGAHLRITRGDRPGIGETHQLEWIGSDGNISLGQTERPVGFYESRDFFQPQENSRSCDAHSGKSSELEMDASQSYFVSHTRYFSGFKQKNFKEHLPFLFTPGVASWKRLAEQDVWIHGCGESLGLAWWTQCYAQLKPLGVPSVLNVLIRHGASSDLAHDAASSSGSGVSLNFLEVAPSLEQDLRVKNELPHEVQSCLWSSPQHFNLIERQNPGFLAKIRRHALLGGFPGCSTRTEQSLLKRKEISWELYPRKEFWYASSISV